MISSQLLSRKKLIILTTAITRGDVHKQTIGTFYEIMGPQLNELFDITHIVNIDAPPKLNGVYKIENTANLISSLIPSFVRQHIIYDLNDKTPSFGKAYSNVIKNINMDEDNTDAIVWWFEDDWRLCKEFNISYLLLVANGIVDSKSKSAISVTNNAPLCSFRGGPIMTMSFFKQYFDMADTIQDFDPEYKVGKRIRDNRCVPIYNGNINIMCMHIIGISSFPFSMKESCPWWYTRKYSRTKFEDNFGIQFILGAFDPATNTIYHKTGDAYGIFIDNIDQIENMSSCTISEFGKLFNNSEINYTTIVPHIFEDIGRAFNLAHGFVKS